MRLMMELSSKMLDEEHGRRKYAARLVGENKLDKESYWVMSESVQLSADGSLLKENNHFCGYDIW